MTSEQLKAKSKADLLTLAKKAQITGYSDMNKDQLVRSLLATPPVPQTKTKAPTVEKQTPAKADQAKQHLSTSAATPKTANPVRSSDENLVGKTRDELAAIARARGAKAVSKMTKPQLLAAISKLSGAKAAPAAVENKAAKPKPAASNKAPSPTVHQGAARRTNAMVNEPATGRARFQGVATRDISESLPRDLPKSYGRDRIVVMVRDPFWLHVYWELTRQAVDRAQAALGQDWYTAKPILRLIDVTCDDTTNASEMAVRDISIHGGVNNWYIDVQEPPRSFRVDIGYLTDRGRFFVVARSNVVTTPKPGVSDQIDQNWQSVQADFEKIYAMSGGYDPETHSHELRELFEERLRRPMNSGSLSSFGSGALGDQRRQGFHFNVDAELIVYGSTDRAARVTMQGQPVQLRPDGTFTMRFSLPDGRQIIPAVAQTYDGIEERTIILAIERNTKELEPMIHDGQEQ